LTLGMKAKAQANLMACRRLMEAKLYAPGASRLYYALFQAAVHALGRLGKKPSDFTLGATQWKHEMVKGNVYLCRKRKEDSDLYRSVLGLRVDADYTELPIEPEDVDPFIPDVDELVREVTR